MNRYSFRYSHNYTPPAAVIEVRLRSQYGISASLPAFIDSGADGTLVPLTFLRTINADYADKTFLIGATGNRQSVGLYEIQVQIGDKIIYGIDAVAYGNEIILGRDVLNQLTVLLDGPLGACEIAV